MKLCPFCYEPFQQEGLCDNPSCWVDSNPKPRRINMAPKFPTNVLVYARHRLSGEDFTDGEAGARDRGEKQAMLWVQFLYGVCSQLDEFVPWISGFSLEHPVATRPKREFALLVEAMILQLETKHEFDSQKGWAQIHGHGIEVNEAYGFYDALGTMMDNFDLWPVVTEARAQA